TSSSAILWEAALSFLGLGVQPPTPSWGLMMAEARAYMRVAPHAIVFPGLAIFLLVFSINVLGEKLRDLLDPRYRTLSARS
ncbi:MAG: ABC transporter permease, partial [Acidilobaceae archaeon]